jgi:hypothetical protein
VNTKGHESVFEEAGRPLLEAAFGKDNHSLAAMHLGNWLTDLSQVIDPVTFAGARSKGSSALRSGADELRRFASEMVDLVAATVSKIGGESMREDFEESLMRLKAQVASHIEKSKEELSTAIDTLLEPRETERSSQLTEFIRSAVLVVGYFKFAYPNRMNFDSFLRVFGPRRAGKTPFGTAEDDWPGAFTQYYPHEHLDRPEVKPGAGDGNYAPRVANGRPPGPRSKRRTKGDRPDLFSYLRDDLEMTAGLLGEVDLEIQQAIVNGVKADAPAWHVTLAKLGHAMHQVEDFFAHSNWIETAALHLGEPFLSEKVLAPATGKDLLDRHRDIFFKRLKQYFPKPEKDWRNHPEETWIVTGFYDLYDTVISLAHLAEALFPWEPLDPIVAGHEAFQTGKEAIAQPKETLLKFQAHLVEALETVSDPEKAFDDQDNLIAQALNRRWGKDYLRVTLKAGWKTPQFEQVLDQFVRIFPPVGQVPEAITQALFFLLQEGYRFRKIMSLFKALREIAMLWVNPEEWIKKKVGETALELAKGLGFNFSKALIEDRLGAGRIGCHSLLAKDDETEFLYKQNRECALAVHYTIVKTLLRWKEPGEHTPVDWLDLLEFFLRNPRTDFGGQSPRYVTKVFEGTLEYLVQRDDQLKSTDLRHSLEHKFKSSAKDPQSFTWRTIADANFNTANLSTQQASAVINSTLAQRSWGYRVSGTNYAFKEGVLLRIPNQKIRQKVPIAAPEAGAPWWQRVLQSNDGWAKIFRSREAPYQPYRLQAITEQEAKDIRDHAARLRRKWRRFYAPASQT